jgi:hypothetical protein
MLVATHKNELLHLEQELWAKELSYLHEEISVLERFLAEVYYRNNHEDVLSQIDHFETRFILQKDWLSKMKHDIEHYENPSATSLLEPEKELNHNAMKIQMEVNRNINNQLKDSFLKFLVKWM